jgi:cytochrome c-type biogenesis protein
VQENISLGIAFLAGVISFLSPCVLPMVPAYLAFISGVSIEELTAQGADRRRIARRVITRSLAFILGLTVVFVALGTTASALGTLLQAHRALLAKIAGAIIIVFGLHLIGVLRLTALYRERRFQAPRRLQGLLGAFAAGLAFAFGWSPCVGPVLGAILALAATQETVLRGMALLLLYSVGLGLPLLLTALATNALLGAFNRVKRAFHAVEIIGGALLILVGVFLITGYIHQLAGRLSFLDRVLGWTSRY